MRNPRAWDSGARDSSDAGKSLPGDALVSTKSRASIQAQATLDRLARYRIALDHWRVAGDGPMPKPADHGVHLPDLEPVQVHWGVP